MAGKVLGLCFLLLGITGMVNASVFVEYDRWNPKLRRHRVFMPDYRHYPELQRFRSFDNKYARFANHHIVGILDSETDTTTAETTFGSEKSEMTKEITIKENKDIFSTIQVTDSEHPAFTEVNTDASTNNVQSTEGSTRTEGSISSEFSADTTVSHTTISETNENTSIFAKITSSRIQSKSTEISQKPSTLTSNFISSATSESTTRSAEKETTKRVSSTLSSTKSISSTGSISTKSVPEDHVIKISSIRTARIVISVIFLVMSLIAMTALAVYMFRVKRRAVQYDQLLLLPP